MNRVQILTWVSPDMLRQELKNMKKKIKEPKGMVCTLPGCGHKCNSIKAWRKHIASHTKAKEGKYEPEPTMFKCTVPGCGREFKTKEALMQHKANMPSGPGKIKHFPEFIKRTQIQKLRYHKYKKILFSEDGETLKDGLVTDKNTGKTFKTKLVTDPKTGNDWHMCLSCGFKYPTAEAYYEHIKVHDAQRKTYNKNALAIKRPNKLHSFKARRPGSNAEELIYEEEGLAAGVDQQKRMSMLRDPEAVQRRKILEKAFAPKPVTEIIRRSARTAEEIEEAHKRNQMTT